MAKAKKKAPAKKAAKKAAKKTVKKTAKKAVKKAAKKPAAKKSNAKVAKKAASPKKTKVTVEKKPAAAAAKVKWDQFLTPLDDRLIVEIASAERMTAGGLYIPDSASDLSGNFQGTVLVAGRGHRDPKGRVRPMDVKSGDSVLFSEFSGSKINLLGKEVLILRESEILGIVDKK